MVLRIPHFKSPRVKPSCPGVWIYFCWRVRMYNSCMIWTRMRCVCACVCAHVFACVSHLVCFVHCDIMSPLLVPTDIALSDPITYQPRQVLEPPWILTNILAKQFPLFVSLGSFLLHHIFNFIFIYIPAYNICVLKQGDIVRTCVYRVHGRHTCRQNNTCKNCFTFFHRNL